MQGLWRAEVFRLSEQYAAGVVKKNPAQLAFPMPEQPQHVESARLYEAVVALRKRGMRVIRAGSQHLVDGMRLEGFQVVNLSNSLKTGEP